MRLTQYTDYSLRVLMYLALQRPERATIRAISEAYGISRNHLMKVAQQLAREGFVNSSRGVGGGLELSRPPEAISLGQVVRRMEPDFGLVECYREENRCPITPVCALPGMLDKAMNAFLEVLDGHTLADLVPAKGRRQLGDILLAVGA